MTDRFDSVRFPFLANLLAVPARLVEEKSTYHAEAPTELVAAIDRLCDRTLQLLGYKPGVVLFERQPGGGDWFADISPRGRTSEMREGDLAALVGEVDRELLQDPAARTVRWEFLVNGRETAELHTSRPWGTAQFHFEPDLDQRQIVFAIQQNCRKSLGGEPTLAVTASQGRLEIAASFSTPAENDRLAARLRSFESVLHRRFPFVDLALSVAGKPIGASKEVDQSRSSEIDLASEDLGLRGL